MSLFYDQLVKPILFSLDPEKAHRLTMSILQKPGMSELLIPHPSATVVNPSTIDGLYYKNPIGLAAGFDKDGKYYHTMAKFGFGFIEIGTVTPRPQIGNPKPRLFRLVKDEALINRMGFNNDGVDAMVDRLNTNGKPNEVILGGNIGKNKDTPNEDAHKDYIECFSKLYDLVDYFTVNVSSPNTPGLRSLQNKDSLLSILGSLQSINRDNRPIYLKIAPDLTSEQISEIADVVSETQINGIITNNTSVTRDPLLTSASEIEKIGAGGLSGKPIKTISDEVLKTASSLVSESKTIIASGGVSSPEAFVNKLSLGADLVQIYTGLIYQGPGFVSDILKELEKNS